MITPDDELGLLLAASPVFAEVWGDRALGRAARATRGPWVLRAFGGHASYLIANRQLDLVPPVFHVVCYFLEGVWIELKKRGVPPAMMEPWLGPEGERCLQFLKQALPDAISE